MIYESKDTNFFNVSLEKITIPDENKLIAIRANLGKKALNFFKRNGGRPEQVLSLQDKGGCLLFY